MALISLDHVNKIYPKASRAALDDINLQINRGDFVFLVGASGSGKTSLLRLLTHEEEATGGEIRVAGHDLRRMKNRQVPQYRRQIGTIFQDYKLLTNKTVWQNVAFALEVLGTSRSTIKSLVPKVLETVGLTGKEKNYPHELSGGEQQRVTIARAYVNHPQILLADEPTGNLDPTTSLGIMEVLDAINRTGTTIVMATHNEEIVNSMQKRVVELHAGKVVRDEQEGRYDSAEFFPDAKTEAQAHEAISALGVSDTEAVSVNEQVHGDAASVISAETGAAGLAKLAAGPRPTDNDDSGLSDTKDQYVHHPNLDHTGDLREQTAANMVEAVSDAVHADHAENEGIARLAKSVHSGNTGRYGEVFAPLEHTLTWGKGLNLEEMARAEHEAAESAAEQSQSTEQSKQPEQQAHAEQTQESSTQQQTAAMPKPVSAPPQPPAPPAPPAPKQSNRNNGTKE